MNVARTIAVLATVAALLAGAAAVFPSAAAPGASLEAWRTTAGGERPCPPIDASDPRDVLGGCQVEAKGRVRFAVLSPIGEIRFAECAVPFTLHVDRDARTALHALIVGQAPCNDARPCKSTDPDVLGYLPWHGRLERGPNGILLNTMSVCLDTCMGVFKGRLTIELRPEGDRWKVEAVNEPVGTSGFLFDGAWTTGPVPLELRRAGS